MITTAEGRLSVRMVQEIRAPARNGLEQLRDIVLEQKGADRVVGVSRSWMALGAVRRLGVAVPVEDAAVPMTALMLDAAVADDAVRRPEEWVGIAKERLAGAHVSWPIHQ